MLVISRAENNAIKLWIPQESDFSLNYAWLWKNFPPELRQVPKNNNNNNNNNNKQRNQPKLIKPNKNQFYLKVEQIVSWNA